MYVALNNIDKQSMIDKILTYFRNEMGWICKHVLINFISIFLLKSDGEKLQHIHFRIFLIIMYIICCENKIWTVKILAFCSGSGTKSVVSNSGYLG